MDNVKILDGKKFMWDGKTYETEAEAAKTKAEYEKNNFETRLLSEGGKYFLFTRRVVTEIVVEGQPPL
jgi:3-mercaptopyruvate sulfurtransferase SseA